MENISNNSNNTIDCFELFDKKHFVIAALVSSVTALISVFACTGVILLVVLFKKYNFFTQRLILYLNLAALFNSVAIALRLQRLAFVTNSEDNPHLTGLCVFTGFIDQVTAWSEVIAISCITFNLLLKAVFHKQVGKLEIVYFILIFIFPLTFNWIPFIDSAYGKAGAWCWIRNQNDDCTDNVLGYYSRLILWYIPAYVILLIIVCTYIFILYKVKTQHHLWEGKYDPETERRKEMQLKEVRPLLWYPLIFLLLNLFPLINRIYDASEGPPIIALWYLQAIFSPLQGGFIAIVYTLDKETRQRLNCTEIRGALSRADITEYPAKEGFSDSFRNGESSTKREEEVGHSSMKQDNGVTARHTYNSISEHSTSSQL